MRLYTVSQNEDLRSILFRLCGTADTTKVLEYKDNQRLLSTRTEYVLHPGDKVWIPDERGIPIHAWGNQGFVINPSKGRTLSLRIQTKEGRVLASLPYKLYVSETIIDGETDGDGMLRESVPFGAKKARLDIAGVSLKLELAGLNPPHTVSGIQGRLANLGYYVGPIDGVIGPESKKAIRKFQQVNGLKVDGVAGPKTREELVRQHGC